tara:strand:- start:5024 stop:5263 length:240 start_codon:yes stop_codon:yes gene_type:complete
MATLKSLVAQNIDFYGLQTADADSDDNKEVLQATYTNAIDNIDVATHPDGTDVFRDTLISTHGLVFAINADGELTIEVK